MKRKGTKSKKGTKPVKGIKHHGIRSEIIFILIIVAVLMLISHPGEVIFGFLSLLGNFLAVAFGTVVVFGIIAFVVKIILSFLL